MAEAVYKKGDMVELLITDLADKDQCFGKLECGMGVMVGGMLAVGDRVSARVTRVRQRYLQALAVEVLEPSPDRTDPVCGDFGVCGGCKLMHILYPAQLRYKEKKVCDALLHIGGFTDPPMLPALGAPSPVHYRNKIEFSCSGKRYLRPEELAMDELLQPKNFALGFHAPGNYEKVIDTARCHLATEEMNSVLRLTRDFALDNAMEPYMAREHTGFLRNLVVRTSVHTGEVMVNIVTSWYECNFSDHGANRLGASALMQGLADGYFILPSTISRYLADEIHTPRIDTSSSEFTLAAEAVGDRLKKLLNTKGTQSVENFHRRLGKIMWEYCGMSRSEEGLAKALELLAALKEEYRTDMRVPGGLDEFNPELEKAWRVADFIELGELMVRDALQRRESCGGHFREEYQTPEGEALRNDDEFAFVALWESLMGSDQPAMHKEPLEFLDIKLSQRSYK